MLSAMKRLMAACTSISDPNTPRRTRLHQALLERLHAAGGIDWRRASDLTGWLWTGLIERISLNQRSWG